MFRRKATTRFKNHTILPPKTPNEGVKESKAEEGLWRVTFDIEFNWLSRFRDFWTSSNSEHQPEAGRRSINHHL